MQLTQLFHFALSVVKTKGIDESHGLSHAMNKLYLSHHIIESELPNKQYLQKQRNIIYSASFLHDLSTSYESDGLLDIYRFLKKDTVLSASEINTVTDIIEALHSKGTPDLGAYQFAYQIVYEADRLAALNFDRSLIYNIHNVDYHFPTAFQSTDVTDSVFVTEYGKALSQKLRAENIARRNTWIEIIK